VITVNTKHTYSTNFKHSLVIFMYSPIPSEVVIFAADCSKPTRYST